MVSISWRQYVKDHPNAHEIIGNGIQKILAEYIPGTRDASNQGKMRMDIHVYRLDGSYSRLHPGPVCKSRYFFDAPVNQKLLYHFPDCRRRPHCALPFYKHDAKSMPLWDMIGKEMMWSLVHRAFATEQLRSTPSATHMDITGSNSPVPWRLWVSNLGKSTDAFIAAGIKTMWVHQQDCRSDNELPTIVFTAGRCDNTVHELCLIRNVNDYNVYFKPKLVMMEL